MTMFQVDLDKLRTYLWYWYEKQWCWGWGCSASPKVLICSKSGQHPWKSALKWRPTLLDFKNVPKSLQKNPWRPFWRPHQKCLNDLCGRECVVKSCTKNFPGKFGEIRAKILHKPKICLLINLSWKITQLLPFWNDSGMNAPAMPPSSGVPVHIILHALSLLVVVGYNLSL